MDIRLVVSNIAAAIILIVGLFAYVGAFGVIDNKDGLTLLIGIAGTYLFTENVVNGKNKTTVS